MSIELLKKRERDIIKKRDSALVQSALSGNTSSFARLMSLYKTRIFYFGKSFFHNDADSEDFVQDVFLKVFMHLDSFKGISQFSTWLMRIAWTTAVNAVNRRKEYLPIADETALLDNDSTPEEQQIKKLAGEAVRQAIAELPEKYAVCIEMYFFYDIPYQEISEITEFPVNTIKSHIFRAKKILREKLNSLQLNK